MFDAETRDQIRDLRINVYFNESRIHRVLQKSLCKVLGQEENTFKKHFHSVNRALAAQSIEVQSLLGSSPNNGHYVGVVKSVVGAMSSTYPVKSMPVGLNWQSNGLVTRPRIKIARPIVSRSPFVVTSRPSALAHFVALSNGKPTQPTNHVGKA